MSNRRFNIKLVSVESGISAIGFRRIAALAKLSNDNVEICYVPTDNKYKTFSYMFPDDNAVLSITDIAVIGKYLAEADIVMFSSMSISKQYVEAIISVIRQFRPKCEIVWGGAHPTLYPEEALKYADIICQGEGDKWIAEYLNIEGMETPELIHSEQGYDCKIYDYRRMQFRALTPKDYAVFNGTLFRTIWTTGCPFSCAYCANDALIKLDPEYRKLKYQSVSWIIGEIRLALEYYPFVTTIAFDDDNFISLPIDIIVQFCVQWMKYIKKPFVIYGMHPNTVNARKVELLAHAGMNRVRMGIQSGSKNILNVYNRPTEPERIIKSANILIDAARDHGMVPPAFDIITDNPMESERTKKETLELLYCLRRPYTLTIFSLRAYPGTKLYDLKLALPDTHYLDTQPTMNNIILYVLAMCKPPRWLFDLMCKHIDNRYVMIHSIVKFCYHVKRGLDHIRRGDFSRLSGKWGYLWWKMLNLRRR